MFYTLWKVTDANPDYFLKKLSFTIKRKAFHDGTDARNI